MSAAETIAGLVEHALNTYIGLDPEAMDAVPALGGRVVALELEGLDLALYVRAEDGRLRVSAASDTPPDTTLRGTPLGLAGLGLPGAATRGLFSGQVSISGDTEAGQRLKELLDGVHIDWEELLSRVTGDMLAHRLASLARQGARWATRSADILTDDVAEYMKEEARLLPARDEVHAFLDDVDRLREAADRLAARVARLQRKLDAGEGQR